MTIMETHKNILLSEKHSIAVRDMFQSYLHREIKKPKGMTLMMLKVCFKVLMKLYNKLKADYELIIQDKD